jgi:hypothetical protein
MGADGHFRIGDLQILEIVAGLYREADAGDGVSSDRWAWDREAAQILGVWPFGDRDPREVAADCGGARRRRPVLLIGNTG